LVYGDTGNVPINHVYVVIPMSFYTFVSSKTTRTLSHTHTPLKGHDAKTPEAMQ